MTHNNMILSVSDLILSGEDKESTLNKIFDIGVECVEITMDGDIWEDYEKTALSIKNAIKNFKISNTIHPPVWDVNLSSENLVIQQAGIDVHLKAFTLANAINSKYVVIHPGFIRSRGCKVEQAIRRSKSAIEMLINATETINLPIAIENVGYNGSSLFTMEEYITFVSTFNRDNVGYLIDTGHAKLNNWDIPMLLDLVGNKLLGMHIHDNHGEHDEHLPVGDGHIDWVKIWDKLKSIDFDHQVYLTLEYAPGISIDRLKEDLKSISEIIY